MELRQAQQSALVRQDEITQLHRDNERLLSEQRATGKELKQAQEMANKSTTRQSQLSEQLARLDSEGALLQERLRVASEEILALKENHDKQSQASKDMELRAAKAEASLEALRLAGSKAQPGATAGS